MPLAALDRYEPNERSAKASEWGKRSAKQRQPPPIDWETVRYRSLQDRRGTVIRNGLTYTGAGNAVQWVIRHSINGKSNQLDVLVNGSVLLTAGERRINTWLRTHTK